MNEKNFLSKYDSSKYSRPNLTVDIVILAIIDNKLNVLTVQRNEPPYQNKWALVGGFIDIEKDKTIEDSAHRKLFEKTGLKTPYLEQFETIGNNNRDPRGWSATTVYYALVDHNKINLKKGKSESNIKWSPVINGKTNQKLAFDHTKLLSGCLERIRSKTMYTTLPTHLMPEKFTLSELKAVYETLMEKKITTKSFHRRMLASNLLQDTGERKTSGRRPARVYQLKDNTTCYFSRNIGDTT